MERQSTRLAELSRENLMRRMLEGGHLNPMAEARVRKELDSSPKILGTLQANGKVINKKPV